MNLMLKKINMYRRGLQFGKSYVNFVKRFVHQEPVDHKEQIHLIKTMIENKNSNWTSIKHDVLCQPGMLNSKNIDAVMLRVFVTEKKFEMALSFAKYLKSSSELSLGAINAILNLYHEYSKENKLSDDEIQFILDNYKSLYDKYKILDATTCEKLLHALCSIDEWKKSIKVFDDISLTNTPSHSTYSFLIATLFRNNKRAEALKMIEKSVQNRRPLQDVAYDEWMKYIFRKYKDKKILLKHLNEVCQHISNNCAIVSAVTAQRLKESYESLSWRGDFTQIVLESGKCTCCNQNLDCLALSEEEFSILQKNVKEKLIVGSDLLLKTSPDELKRFLDFVNRTSPYDIVLDGLNIAFAVGKCDIHSRVRVLGNVIDYFNQQKKRILLLGRKHMLKWRQIHTLTRRTESFFIDDISQDDPYFITAAILSGPHTDIVSRDLLRGHRFLMKEEQLKLLFQRWQWQHQWMVFVPKFRPVIQPPLKFTPITQRSKYGWHLPYLSEKSPTIGQVNNGIPDCSSWLCLKQNSK